MIRHKRKEKLNKVREGVLKPGKSVTALEAEVQNVDKILQIEKEKTLLLSIIESISRARTPIKLVIAINEKVKQVIRFDDVRIFLISKDGLQDYDMTENFEQWMDSEENQRLLYKGFVLNNHKGSYIEYAMKKMEKYECPVIEDYTIVSKKKNYPSLNVLTKKGYKEGMGAILESTGRKFGCFWLNSKQKNNFNKGQFALFHTIAEQLCVCIANMLANEEIIKREKDKSLLLSLSEDIAGVRTRDDLYKVIKEKIHPIIGHNNIYLSYLNDKNETAAFSYKNAEDEIHIREHYKKYFREWFPVVNTPFEMALQSEFPAVFTKADILKSYPGCYHMKVWERAGVEESIEVQLKWRNKVIGFLSILSKQKNGFVNTDLALIKSVANQITISIANIIANEDIIEREKEKTILLSVSKQFATIRSREDLFGVIINQLKPIIPFDHTVITLYNAEKTRTQQIHVVLTDKQKAIKNYNGTIDTWWPVTDTPWED